MLRIIYPSILKSIESVLRKKCYFNLENVNILLEFCATEKYNHFEQFLNILKRNKQLLKYQFKQLNIGLFVDSYYIIKWNSTIDDKFIDKVKMICCSSNEESEKEKGQGKFQEMLNQWG